MQSDQQYFPPKPGVPLTNQVGNGYMQNAPFPSFFSGTVSSPSVKHFPPFPNVDFQPSTVCPRNFIIFDRTDNQSQVMYHPAIAPKFGYPGLNVGVPYFQDNAKRNYPNDEREILSSLKEDSADIDALLSLEDEEEEEDDDEEEVSTARTHGNYESDSADSCSSKPRKSMLPSSSQKSTGSSSSSSQRKRQKMRKMVKALRGIVPGGNRLNTVAVLDEAVRYLKSLKVEVQKIGVANLKN